MGKQEKERQGKERPEKKGLEKGKERKRETREGEARNNQKVCENPQLVSIKSKLENKLESVQIKEILHFDKE